MDGEARSSLLDAFDARVEPYINAGVAHTFRQPAHKVGVELLKHALRALKDGDLGAGARRDVRKLSGYVAAADKHYPFGQLVQFQKFCARDEVLFARHAKADGNRPGRYKNESGLALVVSNSYRVRVTESRAAAISIDAFLGEAALHHGGDGLGEASLKLH